MRINNIILILMALFAILIKGCNSPKTEISQTQGIEQKEEIKIVPQRIDYPYIVNGILYTKTKTIPISTIKRVDVNEDSVKYFVLSYKLDKYTGGMITMTSIDFKKIEKQLLGDTYEKKADEARKKASESKSFLRSFLR